MNGQTITDHLNRGWLRGGWFSGSYTFTAGQKVPLEVEYYESSGNAEITLYWESADQLFGVISNTALTTGEVPPPAPTGWTARYFDGRQFEKPVLTPDRRRDRFRLDRRSRAGVVPGNFSVKWSGLLTAPHTGIYTFTTAAYGTRLWINGQLVSGAWEGDGRRRRMAQRRRPPHRRAAGPHSVGSRSSLRLSLRGPLLVQSLRALGTCPRFRHQRLRLPAPLHGLAFPPFPRNPCRNGCGTAHPGLRCRRSPPQLRGPGTAARRHPGRRGIGRSAATPHLPRRKPSAWPAADGSPVFITWSFRRLPPRHHHHALLPEGHRPRHRPLVPPQPLASVHANRPSPKMRTRRG